LITSYKGVRLFDTGTWKHHDLKLGEK